MGMNFQDVIRDVHDPANHQLKVAASVSASNQVTVQPLAAWPDPKTYIGLVTITGSLAAASGNVTLDAGSRTGIVGNITLSDPKGFIGLVTVVGSLSPAAGNVTLDAGSRTGILGNVTLSNPNTYIGLTTSTLGIGTQFIGLTTVVQASSARTITGNITLSDSKTYIGLTTATIGNNPILGAGVNNIGFATVSISTPTLFAVVNVGAAGTTDVTSNSGVTVYQGGTWTVTQASAARTITSGTITAVTDITNPVAIKGNITLSDPKGYIGLVTVTQASSARTITGNITLSDAKTYIGLTTTTLGTGLAGIGFATVAVSTPTLFAVVNTGAAGDPGTYIGLVTATLSVGTSFIGLVTVVQSSAARTITSGTITAVTDVTNPVALKGNMTLSDSKTGIGLVSIFGGAVGLNAGVNSIGFASVTPVQAWPDPKGYIGLVTITGSLAAASGNVTLDAGSRVGLLGNVTLSDSKTFIGLTTSVTRNAGTNKTLLNLPIAFSAASITTIAIPASSNSIYVTNLLLNSSATVRVTLKSGVTYMLGNASIGVTLNPGGGFPLTGSPDSPSWIGLPSGALVIEKFDMTGTAAQIGGNVVYFQE